MDRRSAARAESIQQQLRASRERLLASIAGVGEEQFKRRPPSQVEGAPPDWSIAEILAHLLQSERLRGERIALALEQDGAVITPSAPELHAEGARAGRAAPVPQLIHGLLAARREIERQLDKASSIPHGLDLAVLHPRDGRQSIGWMIAEKVVAHELEHVDQIEAVKATIGAGRGSAVT